MKGQPRENIPIISIYIYKIVRSHLLALVWSTEKPTYQHTNCVEFHVYKLCMCTVHCACCHIYLNRRLRSLSPVFQMTLAHFAVAVAAARSQCKRMHSFTMNSRRTKRADTKKKHLKNSQYSREVLNFL